MAQGKPINIPVRPAPEAPTEEDLATSACSSGEPYALMVLGDSMLPEFAEGEIIVVEPEGLARDGSYVIAWANEEYIFRQLVQHDDGWMLKPLNPTYPNIPVDDLKATIKGVIILKKQPGRRKEQKSYV
ncbi:MAG: S24 family peptidase [Hydrogenophilales bacterium]|nr:S24 family peptidase [Hydrogenophilales bacterium]